MRRRISLDAILADEKLAEKSNILSDRGAGVEAIVAACDGENTESHYDRLLRKARDHVRNTAPHLLEVLNLVVKNGSDRKTSIWEMIHNSGKPQSAATGEDSTPC